MPFRTLQAPNTSTDSGFRPLTPSTPKPGLFASIKEDVSRRDQNVKTSVSASKRGEQSHVEGVYQAGGQVAGLIGDIVTRLLGKAASAVTPDVIEKPVRQATSAALQTVVASAPVQKTVEKYQGFKEQHPRAARNVEAGINILSVLPEAKAGELGAKGAAKTATRAVKPVLKGVDKASDILGDLPRRLEQTNLRLTPVQKQKLGKKLQNVTNFIADEQIVGDQAKKFDHVSKITDGMEETLQNHLTKELGDPVVPTVTIKDRLKALKTSDEFKNERDLPLIQKQIDGMVSRIDIYGDGIKLSDLNQLKRSTYKEAYNKAGDKVADWVEHDMGDILRQTIEETAEKSGKKIDSMTIGEFNRRYGTAIEARKLLKVSSTRAETGLIAKIAGTIAGAGIGTAIGGPVGGAVGAYIGPQIGERVGGSTMRSFIGAGIKKTQKNKSSGVK